MRIPTNLNARSRRIRLATIVVAVLSILQPVSVFAVQGPGSAADPGLTALEQELARAKLEAELAAARRTAFEASLPKSTVTPLEGTTTIDDKLQIESEMMAYEAVDRIAREVADRVLGETGDGEGTIVIHDEATVAALRLYEVFLTQTAILLEAYASTKKAHDQATAPDFTSNMFLTEGVSAFARSAFDLLALFRQNTEYKGRAVTINEDALAAKVAGYLVEPPHRATVAGASVPKLTVVCPRLLLRRAATAGSAAANSNIVTQLKSLYTERNAAVAWIADSEKKLAPLRKAKLDADAEVANLSQVLKNLELEIPSLKGQALADKVRDLNDKTKEKKAAVAKANEKTSDLLILEAKDGPIRDQYRAINALFDQLVASLVKTDEKTGLSPLGLLTRAAEVVALLDDLTVARSRFVLFTKSVSAGGSYRIRRNLWTTVFTGDLLSYSGGAIVSYMLFDNSSRIRSADTLRYMTGFSKFKKLQKVPEGTNF